MKKALLILAVALVCLTCLFVVPLAAEGNTTPALSINYTNLSFKDSVYIKYAVAAENVTKEDVRLLVFAEPQQDYTDASKATVLLPKYLDEIEGKEYIIFDYTALSAKQMTDVVYARAMVEVDGEVYYSNIKKFSILEYAKAVENNANAKQSLKNMLAGMLDYGALAQTHFEYKADRPANGMWVNIGVMNGTLPDGFADGMYMVGDTLTLIPAEAPGGKVFSHWENSAGEEQTLPIVAPAQNETYTAVYKDEIAYYEGIELTKNDDGASYSVTSVGTYTGSKLIIPATYEGLPVTAIGKDALKSCAALTSVTIPDSVTVIGEYAFFGCNNLTDLVLSNNVVTLEKYAFYGCNNLSGTVTIPGTCEYIGSMCFYDIYGMPNARIVIVPDSLEFIGYCAFLNVDALTWESDEATTWDRTVSGTHTVYSGPSGSYSYQRKEITYTWSTTLSSSTAQNKLNGTTSEKWVKIEKGYLASLKYSNCTWTRVIEE